MLANEPWKIHSRQNDFRPHLSLMRTSAAVRLVKKQELLGSISSVLFQEKGFSLSEKLAALTFHSCHFEDARDFYMTLEDGQAPSNDWNQGR